MEAQLQPLIDTIKAEGIEAAQAKAKEIIGDAEARAAQIVDEAGRQAKDQVETARREAERFETAGQDALRQAARDLVLSVDRQLQDRLNKLMQDQVGEALTSDRLVGIIEQLVGNWRAGSNASLEVLLSDDNREALANGALSALREKLGQGVTLNTSSDIDTGLCIGLQNGNVHYDFTGGGVAEMLSEYLSTRLAELMRG
jgi:V/A-type H+-transporting ATPase subunit E